MSAQLGPNAEFQESQTWKSQASGRPLSTHSCIWVDEHITFHRGQKHIAHMLLNAPQLASLKWPLEELQVWNAKIAFFAFLEVSVRDKVIIAEVMIGKHNIRGNLVWRTHQITGPRHMLMTIQIEKITKHQTSSVNKTYNRLHVLTKLHFTCKKSSFIEVCVSVWATERHKNTTCRNKVLSKICVQNKSWDSFFFFWYLLFPFIVIYFGSSVWGPPCPLCVHMNSQRLGEQQQHHSTKQSRHLWQQLSVVDTDDCRQHGQVVILFWKFCKSMLTFCPQTVGPPDLT